MRLIIKNDEARRLANELAVLTGETLTSAVTLALARAIGARAPPPSKDRIAAELVTIGSRYAALPDAGRSPDEILGYDRDGLPTSS